MLATTTAIVCGQKPSVVLAYSGGLDTSVIIPWLKENYDYEVIACCANVGQGAGEIDGLEEKAKKAGASKLYLLDLREEYVTDYIFPTLKAGAMYEGKYMLGTSHARPLIAKHLVEVAHKEGAVAICHGATGKGNDQVRFELAIMALDPSLKCVAPWREWNIKSREDAIDYAEAHGVPVPCTKSDLYSRDRNLWHISHEGMDLEDPAKEPAHAKLLRLCNTVEKAPDEAEYVTVQFEKGIPVAVNGRKMASVELVEELNALGGKHAIGIEDIVEDRLVGMKSRGVYETPAGTILYKALDMLESLCLDRDTQSFKRLSAVRFSELVYDGKWFTPLRESMSAMFDKMAETVTGEATLKLYKGNLMPAGAKSPYSLYDESIASFGDSHHLYNHHDAEGFIRLFGLPLRVRSMMLQAKEMPSSL
ncbi:putative argininosuccinate synthase [Leishmania major strain Friedlin]|uniref:argininosuccinate synthase n=2 Tax=Leishmania major TaxID=5664 RepID=Q4QBE8_LEIMA|nr:putative argininosuccinate synthase [Leishmania major strain Friedlin]CAG9574122.1 argininosuccinate_synthase_-_putative [Leishmania major strain Friedlin]CAJ03985.1 putative argininosuccinate synthase [Leishmania major strain Friedlin]|eukprot:XP_001683350.1 putative argininosuccinate synthase [Leishmania major strain Friedlin]